ncbi:DnaJ protein [Nymphaea thermarum]|nr:DnaJ protein [Nymphaea thermarum]
MGEPDENSFLFPIFVLAIMALFLVPYTIHRISQALSKKAKNICCQCSICLHSGKYRKSIFKRISNFSTCRNLTVILLWVFMAVLAYYVKNITREIQPFEPFEILGLKPGSTDSEIKKAYRKLSILYHPDKNPDPEAHKYFVEYISKAYQALTDPVSRENFEKYGHPDGRQGFQMGIALPQFLLSKDGTSSGVLLLGIVGICILLPLVLAVIYLSRSSKYTGNRVRHETLYAYYNSMKPSLAPSKVMEVFIKAAEYMELPVRRSDMESLEKLFTVVRTELGLDTKNMRQEQAKFWKRNPAAVKAELLILAQLTRESASVPLDLKSDFKHVIELAPHLLEELLKMAIVRRSPAGHGWLRPAIGVLELSQSIVQAVPLSARKAVGGFSEGNAPFLQLPHFSESVVKKISRKKLRSFQELKEMAPEERSVLLTDIGNLSGEETRDVEAVLDMMPSLKIDVNCVTEGEDGIQEGDVVTMHAWISLKRTNGLTAALPHCPYLPFHKDENYWFILADSASNDLWVSQRVSFMEEAAAIATASHAIEESKEGSGTNSEEIRLAVHEAVEKVKNGSRFVIGQFEAPAAGTYNLTAYCICDSWIGCDTKTSFKLKVTKQKHAVAKSGRMDEEELALEDGVEDEEEADEGDDDYESEYSDDGEDKTKKGHGKQQDSNTHSDSDSSSES